jgi:hypothetical protein
MEGVVSSDGFVMMGTDGATVATGWKEQRQRPVAGAPTPPTPGAKPGADRPFVAPESLAARTGAPAGRPRTRRARR